MKPIGTGARIFGLFCFVCIGTAVVHARWEIATFLLLLSWYVKWRDER